MSEKQSKGVQKQKEKGGNKVAFTVGGAVVIVAIVVIVILVLVNRSGGMEEDNLPTVPIGENANVQGTLVDESYSAPDPEDDTVGFGYYEVLMSRVEWYVDSETSTTRDVYITNKDTNVYDMYFELVEESTETLLYTSPVLEIGDVLENLTLDTPLDAGRHTCVMVHHLLDPLTGEEVDGLELYVEVVIF